MPSQMFVIHAFDGKMCCALHLNDGLSIVWLERCHQQDLLQQNFANSQFSFLSSAFNYDAENMNSEEIYCSLRGMTEAIQNFSLLSQEEMNEPLKRDAKKEEDMEQVIISSISINIIWLDY